MIQDNDKDSCRRSTMFSFSNGLQKIGSEGDNINIPYQKPTFLFGSKETEGSVKSVRLPPLQGWRTEDSAVPNYRQDVE